MNISQTNETIPQNEKVIVEISKKNSVLVATSDFFTPGMIQNGCGFYVHFDETFILLDS